MNEKGPLGIVERFYIKKEYQQRGAPHMHVMLWIKNAPIHGKNKDEEVLSFITDRITCCLPDAIESPILHSLVSKNQTHCCTKSCLRSKTVKGKYFSTFCRYGFPRQIATSAALNTTEAVLEAKVRGKGRIKLYTLPRKATEIMINDYNPALLYLWEANIDIQYINDVKNCLVYYTTSYVCKAERQLMSQVADTINTNLSTAGMAKQMACKLLSSRQLGAYEAADKVLRHPIYRLSEDVVSPAFYLPGEQRRRLKPKAQIEDLESDSTDVFCRNFQNSYYPQRPSILEKCSAYELLRSYEIKYGEPKKNKSLYMKPFNAYFARRNKKAIVRLWKTYNNDSSTLERYCFQVVALFKPWRGDKDLLEDLDGNPKSSYPEVYNSIRDKLSDMQEFESSRERLAAMIEWAEDVKKEAQKRLEAKQATSVNQQPPNSDTTTTDDIDQELSHQSKEMRKALTEASVIEQYQQLNTIQQKVFDEVIDQINENPGQNEGRIKRIFLSGVGGTGKSFVITALRNHLEYYYSNDKGPAVLVAAPTGVAAANIDGITIHKLLKLPVSKSTDKTQKYWNLHPQDAKILRMLFKNVKLLIIDEISMLSNLYLLFIHKRLNEILIDQDNDPMARFACLNILLLGDLLQLPPVNAPYIFQRLTNQQITDSFGSLGTPLNLWNLFDFRELTENMRQKDDLTYAKMLDRIRIGSPTTEDLCSLRSRCIDSSEDTEWSCRLEQAVDKFLVLLEKDKYALCLMPLNTDVTSFNDRVMEILKLPIVKCKAIDSADFGPTRGKKTKSRNPRKGQTSKLQSTAQTGGLEEELSIAVGARVMLRRNLDMKLKLVNGSIGFIHHIAFDPESNEPQVVTVQFQDISDDVLITRTTVKYCIGANLYITRTQFPLTVAYAITIHKCQGLSLDSAMVDMGEAMFCDGMAYVALSRVRKLENLHLIRFKGGTIKCDNRCVQEYNRLHRNCGTGNEVTEYNRNPEFETYCTKVRLQPEEQQAMLREELEMENNLRGFSRNRLATGSKRPKDINSLSTLHPGLYLKLSNRDRHSCFANAVVQCLLRCTQIYYLLEKHSATNAIAQELLKLFQVHKKKQQQLHSTDDIRSIFGTTSQFSLSSNRDCDPVDFLLDILGHIPSEITDSFSFLKSTTGCCPSCHTQEVIQGSTAYLMEHGLEPNVDRYALKEIFHPNSHQIYRCRTCQTLNPQFPTQASYIFPPSNMYLILNVPVVLGNQMIRKPLLGIRERNMSLFGGKWNIIATTQLSGSEDRTSGNQSAEYFEKDPCRHYTAYLHHNDKEWVCLNDSYQNILRSKPVFKDMVLIFLERL